MACVSMCVFPGPCTARGFRVSLHGLIDTDDGFPQCRWVMCFLSLGEKHSTVTHTSMSMRLRKCNEWAWWRSECECSRLSSFYGCYASARVPFLENARLHLHTLKHASCSFDSSVPPLEQDYRSHPRFGRCWFCLSADEMQTSHTEPRNDWDAHEQCIMVNWCFFLWC